jgi:hypothetical protein
MVTLSRLYASGKFATAWENSVVWVDRSRSRVAVGALEGKVIMCVAGRVATPRACTPSFLLSIVRQMRQTHSGQFLES